MRLAKLAIPLLLTSSSLVFAETYNLEVQPSLGFGSVDVLGESYDLRGYGVTGTAFFEPVSTDNGPYAEAAFLGKASGLTASYYSLEERESNEDISTTSIGLTFVGKQSGWFFQGTYLDDDLSDGYDLNVGKYLSDVTAVSVGYMLVDVDGYDVDGLTVRAKHLAEMSETGSLAVNVELGYLEAEGGDNVTLYGGGLTYYANNNLGVGVNLQRMDYDDYSIDSYGINAEYFFSPTASVGLDYSVADEDLLDSETSLFTVSGRFRF